MSGRCAWAEHSDAEREYHDAEWGVPQRDDRALFEMLILEGAQAGLSWHTVLVKRENYRRLFHGFDIARCAKLTDAQLERALLDAGIVRNRLKVYSERKNAQAALAVIAEHGDLASYLWSFVGGKPQVNRPRGLGDVPAQTPASDAMSKALKKRGFSFVGSTICYAFMQATGMVNDHVVTCPFRQQ